jgi:transposase
MGEVTTVGLDIAKSVFQVHGIDAEGMVVVQRKLTRARPARVAAVALANKTARTVWAMMTTGESYREPAAV